MSQFHVARNYQFHNVRIDYRVLMAGPPARRSLLPPPPVVALAGWLVPGLGYLLIGQRARGLTVGLTIGLLFVGGLLIGGVRVLDVPGFDETGRAVPDRAHPGAWQLTTSPVRELRDKPWSVLQVLNGPLFVVAGGVSVWAAKAGVGAPPHARVDEIGTLYTAVAGMLNLLALIDASYRAGREAAK